MTKKSQSSLVFKRLLIVAFATIVSAGRCIAATRDVLASASSSAVFVAQIRAIDSGTEHLASAQTTIYRRQIGGDGRFLKLFTLSGRVISLAAQGDQAVALLEDGQWMTLWPGGNPLGPPIPDARPLAMTAAGTNLWAIALAKSPPATNAADPSTNAAATTSASGPTPDEHASALALFQFSNSAWQRVAALPAAINTTTPEDLSLAVTDDGNGAQIVTVAQGGFEGITVWTERAKGLATRPAGEQAGAMTTTRAIEQDATRPVEQGSALAGERAGENTIEQAGRWTASLPLRAGQLPQEFRVLECGSPATVWSYDDDKQWLSRSGKSRELPDDGSPRDAPRSAACAAEAVRVFSESDGKLFEQAYSLNGKAIGPRAALAIESSLTPTDPESWITTALTVVVTILLVSSVYRSEPGLPESLKKSNLVLAPLGTRLAAGFIDLVPVFVALGLQAYLMRNEESLGEIPTNAQMLPFYIGVGVYLIHTTISELLTARTIGKWAMSIRVASLDGGPIKPMAMLIRNVLRLVDVMLMWIPLSLILISPLRQRLGDLPARTIVVKDAAEEIENEPEPG